MQVANTILEQLGGRRFIAMTGAKNFVGTEDSLIFMIPKALDGVNKIVVKLEPSDTYTVQAYKISRRNITANPLPWKEEGDIYCDELRDSFERLTGLATSLGTMGR